MRGFFITQKNNQIYRRLTSAIAFVLTFSLIFSPVASYAQAINFLNLPIPGTMITPSPAFAPVLLKGMTIHPDNPLQFDFIIDSGNTDFSTDQVKEESEKLVKYFLASMTVPKDDLWVNLSPYEDDRIIPDELGKTELGRDMLAQDYILKQLTASLMYPEDELGKKFWDKVYKKAEEQFGTREIPVNTFNKVWILPESATVYEHEQTVYVVDARLKVMLDSDYAAMQHENVGAIHESPVQDGNNIVIPAKTGIHDDWLNGSPIKAFGDDSLLSVPVQDDLSVSSQIIREIIIPEIEREVNEGTHFAPLRQIYHSLILAKWYKETVKNSLLSQVYADKNLTDGVNVDDPAVKDKIYDRYMQAYKKGVFNYIKEDYDQLSQEMIPRKYFSGGIEELTNVSLKRTNSPVVDSKNLKYRMKVGVSPTGNKEGMLSKLTRMARTATITALISALTYAGGGYDALAQEDNTEVPQTQKALLTTTVSVDNEAKAKDFVMAAYNGDISKVQALLQSGIGVDAKYNGFTALMISAEKGYTEIVKALLNKGADVNIKSSAGWTALIIAAQKGHAKIVEALLDKSTNVDARDKYGLTALDAAKEGKHNDIIEILLEAKAKVQVEQGSQITQNTQIDKDIAEFKSYLKNKSLYVQINGIAGLGRSRLPVDQIRLLIQPFTLNENEMISALAKKVLEEAEETGPGTLARGETDGISPELEKEINVLLDRLKLGGEANKEITSKLVSIGEPAVSTIVKFIHDGRMRNYMGSSNAALRVLSAFRRISKDNFVDLLFISAQDPLENHATDISYQFHNMLNKTICNLENGSIDARLIMLTHPRQATRMYSVMSLGDLKPSAKYFNKAINALNDRLNDVDPKVIAAAIQLGSYGPEIENAEVLAQLINLAQSSFVPSSNYKKQRYELSFGDYEGVGVQGYAARALGELGIVLPTVISALERAVKSANPKVREEATKALLELNRIDTDRPEYLERLEKLLKSITKKGTGSSPIQGENEKELDSLKDDHSSSPASSPIFSRDKLKALYNKELVLGFPFEEEYALVYGRGIFVTPFGSRDPETAQHLNVLLDSQLVDGQYVLVGSFSKGPIAIMKLGFFTNPQEAEQNSVIITQNQMSLNAGKFITSLSQDRVMMSEVWTTTNWMTEDQWHEVMNDFANMAGRLINFKPVTPRIKIDHIDVSKNGMDGQIKIKVGRKLSSSPVTKGEKLDLFASSTSLGISSPDQSESQTTDDEKNQSSSPVIDSEQVGGIDLNEIDVDRQGAGVDIQFDPLDVQAMIDMGITGFAPVIISITPLLSVLPLLGLAPKREEELELAQTS